MNIYITIEDLDSLKSFVREAKKIGLLKEVPESKIAYGKADFPVQLPIDIDAFLKLTGNPIVKKVFGKKIEGTLKSYLIGEIG